jgi:hypothetical protein
MAATSGNKYDVFSWIVSIYSSCETLQHLLATKRLERKFNDRFDDVKLKSRLDGHWMIAYQRLQDKTGKT